MPYCDMAPRIVTQFFRRVPVGAFRTERIIGDVEAKRLAVRAAEENFQKIVARAGPFSIPKVTPHSLRHAFASHTVDGKQDMVVLKHILGHALM